MVTHGDRRTVAREGNQGVGSACDAELTPVLTANPDHHVYVTGESVTLTCNVPGEETQHNFTFFKDKTMCVSQNSSTLHIPRLDSSYVAIYTCEYWHSESSSPKSNQRAIHVHDRPPAPFISMSQLYMGGKRIYLNCSAAGGSGRRQVTFYRNEQKILSADSFPEIIINEIVISVQAISGKFSCDYRIEKLGRWIHSLISGNVSIPDSITGIPTLITRISQTSEHQTGYDVDIKTSPTTSTSTADYTAMDYIAMASTFSTTHQGTNFEGKQISPASHTSTAIVPSISQHYAMSQWTTDNNWMNSSSSNNDLTPTWIYYSVGGSLVFVSLCVLMAILLLRSWCARKGTGMKRKGMRGSLWMKSNTRDSGKSVTTSPPVQIPMIVQEKEELHLYTEINLCPVLGKPSPAPKLSTSMGSLVYCLDSGADTYTQAQAIDALSPVYYASVPQ
ncbi:uncharacterized protein LOC134970551 [Pseudophryne corroboree]|uniref:uncharacterized protein LOC134970551 n=1 Tax=Pseudophryne corroboree TaxID=495146 RepID=UPI0030821ACF